MKIKLCFVIFVAWVKRTTLTRHLSSREHQDATMKAQLRETFAMMIKKFCPPIVPTCPLPKALKGETVSQGQRAGLNPDQR